jgi:hypothetical protein
MASAMPPAPKIDVGFSPEGSPSSSNAISEQGGVSNVYTIDIRVTALLRGEPMKTASERMQERLRKDRPMAVISLRMPEDVIEELKEIAPSLGFSGYQPLIRAYIGQGLRKDQARVENSQVQRITEGLRKYGVDDQIISSVIADAQHATA